MFNFLNLFGQREIDEWRDDYVLVAAAALNQLAADMIAESDKLVLGTTLKEGLFGQEKFIAEHIAPLVRDRAEPVITDILDRANRALMVIADHQTIWHEQPSGDQGSGGAFDGWQDVAVAAGPLAGGVAVAAAIPSMAVTTSTTFFGLVSTTIISWPVVVGGGAIAGIAIATGALNTGKIRDKAQSRLRRKVRDYVIATLINGNSKQPAILEQIAQAFDRACSQAKKLK